MKKAIIKFLICILSVCCVLGLVNVKAVRALEIPNSVGGTFEIIGAGVRSSSKEEDTSGIRFTTKLSQKAYKDIITFANGNAVKFGTEIAPVGKEASAIAIQYLSTRPSAGENSIKFKTESDSETIEYYASITYALDDFAKDIESKLLKSGVLKNGEENYEIKLNDYVIKYMQQAYGMQLKATSYFEIQGKRYYTKSIVRSMTMVANYYDKTPGYKEQLNEHFYEKEYFVEGGTKIGYILPNGNIVVKDYDVSEIKNIAKGVEALDVEKENSLFSVSVALPNLNETITLYAFDKENKVTTLNLQYVNEIPGDITIGDNDIETYVIAVDENNEQTKNGAIELQSAISKKIGKNLEIVSLEATENAIIIKQVDKTETVSEGYRVYERNGNLIVECAYMNKFEIAFNNLLEKINAYMTGTLEFESNYSETIDVSKVYYSEFGVKGDGVTNDFFNMKKAHDFANISGQTVYGEEGKTYLITKTVNDKNEAQTITIKTNVDWCNAKIVIDNRYLTPEDPETSAHVFTVANDYGKQTLASYGLTVDDLIPGRKIQKNTTKFEDVLGFSALLNIYNSNRKMFIRYGNPGGGSQSEIFYVDEHANLVDTTILFAFDDVTSVLIYRADNPAVTVKNATIETLACQYNLGTGSNESISRGFVVERPNTTVKNLTHVVTGEIPKGTVGEDGIAYNGMSTSYFVVRNTHNVLVEDCVFQGRTYYKSGTYDISPSYSHKVLFKNCTQSNFFEYKLDENGNKTDELSNRANLSECWGIMGSNGCKHLDLDGCQLTRYDAHAGLTDGKIINSKIGRISVTGGGDLIIENTELYLMAHYIIVLRNDYGAFWNGTITLKDCHIVNAKLDNGEYRQQITLVCDADTVNHNFGYECQFPNFVIDNLKIDKYAANIAITYSKRALSDPSITVYGALDLNLKPNEYVYTPPEYISVLNNENKGYTIFVPTNNGFFDNTIVTNAIRKETSTKVAENILGEHSGFDLSWLAGSIVE